MPRFHPMLLAAGVAASVFAGTPHGHAHPIPLLTQDADGTWQLPPAPAPAVVPFAPPPIDSTDVLSQDLAVDLDPVTQALSASLTLSLRAEEAGVSFVTFLLSADLAITGAQAQGVDANINQQVFGTFNQVTIGFPPMAQGEEIEVVVSYAGTLTCNAPGSLCDVNENMGVMMRGSGLPYLFDASGLGGYNVWGSPMSLEMAVPSGIDVVAPGTLIDDQDDGTTHTRRWLTPGYHNTGAYLVLFGKFGALPVAGSSPATSVYYEATSPAWSRDMSGWMTNILAFLDDQVGAPLDFETLSCVKLPANWVFPGTVAHGTVYLAESYGAPGADYFEETLAHETSHDWWGVLVSPTDYLRSRWLVEGLATLSQVDYAAIHHAEGLSRDAFLERRYREHAQVLRYMAADLPAVVPDAQPTLEGLNDTYWAYIRSSAALDSLRLVMGHDVFADGLRAYAAQCQQALCDTTDFRLVLESVSGLDLSAAFDAFVFSDGYPAITLDHTASSDGVDVVASGHDAPLMLDLEIELVDGQVERRVATLNPGVPTSVVASGPVRSVRPNPRHASVVRARSAQPSDVNFDRDVDGVDVVQCARLVGTSVGQIANGEGIFRLDLDFDTRCDLDENGIIDTVDLEAILQRFGTITEDS
jgi:Peptidase family M1 domain